MGKFLKGLSRDTNPVDQPAGTWRYAKNMVIPPGSGTIQSEKGTEVVVSITGGYQPLGTVLLPDETVCLFSTNLTTLNSEIGIFNPVSGVYTPVYNDTGNPRFLNFQLEFPIQGESKMDITGNMSVYWTDDLNAMRYINLYNPPVPPHDIEDFDIFPQLNEAPWIDLAAMQSGALTTAAYCLTIAYVDHEGTPTNNLTISRWVYITSANSSESGAAAALGPSSAGGSMGLTYSNLDPHNTTTWEGSPPAASSGRGIIFRVHNLDDRYTFIRPTILKREAGVVTAVTLQDVDYDVLMSTTMDISYTGTEYSEAATVEDALIPRETYTKAKTVAQVDDTLYWGNLEKNRIDINYQPYACQIQINAVQANSSFNASQSINGTTVNMELNGSNAQNSLRQTTDMYDYVGYQRDEVYSFYITWLTMNGDETVAYHIPGRKAIALGSHAGTHAGASCSQLSDDFPTGHAGTDPLYENDLAAITEFDLPYMDAPGFSGQSQIDRMITASPKTQIGDLNTRGSILGSHGTGMGYWENKNELYPNDISYQSLDAFEIAGEDLRGQPVRHHHIPSSCLGEGGGHIAGGNGGYGGNQKVNPMTITVTNIPFPQQLIGTCIGYKIYYARRTEGNSVLIDTGIFNAMPTAMKGPASNRWGSTESNSWNTSAWPQNGMMCSAPTGVGSWPNYGYNGTMITLSDYIINPPPGGDDYADPVVWGGITGGDIVAYPFSCVAAPYSDVAWATNTPADIVMRQRKDPEANYFTFNGLHTRLNSPDTSNATFLKVHRHLRIGRAQAAGTYAFMGFYFIRHDNSGNAIKQQYRMSIMLDWTQCVAEEYANTRTYGLLYNTHVVGNSNAQACGNQYPNFRAVGNCKLIPADTNPPTGTGFGGTTINYQGCQTTQVYTYNNLKVHDMSMTMSLYYAYIVYKILEDKSSYSNSGGGNFNYPYLKEGMHNTFINLYDQLGYSYGTWAFPTMAIQRHGYLSAWAGIDGEENWENGWTHSFDCRYIVGMEPVMDDPGTSDSFTQTDTWTNQPDDVIQYMSYGSIHRTLSDLYNTFDTQNDLVYTGYTGDTSAISTPTLITNSELIFGGDTYIDYYMETRQMKGVTWAWPNDGPLMVNTTDLGSGSYANPGLYNGDRGVHYVYGLMGSISRSGAGGEHEDNAQQLYITESKVNIHMRYSDNNPNEGYYPACHFQDQEVTTWNSGPRIFLYNTDHSSQQNLRPIVAFNHLNVIAKQSDFPTRIIRSLPHNKSLVRDNFRMYNAAQYRDLPRHRGELWNLATFDNVLLPQSERTLLKTKGKETIDSTTGTVAGDVTAISIGDGDLFVHDPSEVLYTSRGHAGTTSQYAVVVTKYGHFSVDKQAGKVFLLGEKLEEISAIGVREFLYRRLTTWGLLQYGMPPNLDIPTAGVGIIASWDAQYERYVLTKLDKAPTATFITAYNSGDITFDSVYRKFRDDGDIIEWNDTDYYSEYKWTISYYPALKFWGSVHDFTPRLYFYTSEQLFSISGAIHKHNYEDPDVLYNIGEYYGIDYDVVIEFISNVVPEDNKIYSNFYYTVDVEEPQRLEEGARQERQDPGFDEFTVYNSRQLSQITTLIPPGGEYGLIQSTANVRRKERTWYTNHFRDEVTQAIAGTGTLDVGPNTSILDTNHLTANVNINTGSLDVNKTWNQRRKFADKWLAIRLVMNRANNSTTSGKYLLTLHSADAAYRTTYR